MLQTQFQTVPEYFYLAIPEPSLYCPESQDFSSPSPHQIFQLLYAFPLQKKYHYVKELPYTFHQLFPYQKQKLYILFFLQELPFLHHFRQHPKWQSSSFYLTFNVMIDNTANMIPIIQNLVTILLS